MASIKQIIGVLLQGLTDPMLPGSGRLQGGKRPVWMEWAEKQIRGRKAVHVLWSRLWGQWEVPTQEDSAYESFFMEDSNVAAICWRQAMLT